MNKSQRKELERAVSLLDQAKEIIRYVAEEEEEKFNNLNEGLQAADSGQKLEQYSEDLNERADELESLIENVNEVIND